jgi:hypothetical protein
VKENLLGIISLNYDDILDQAEKTFYRRDPNYCHTSTKGIGVPLLKLHGSFNWTNMKIYEKVKAIPIIPLGINKNYLAPPYNFIWGRAFEVIARCDVLRVIGCSLNQNDVGLIDLLFKAHLERSKQIEIQIIDFQDAAEGIKGNFGFFPGIVTPKDIDVLIADPQILSPDHTGNPFKIWIKAIAESMLTAKRIRKTKYLKKCF